MKSHFSGGNGKFNLHWSSSVAQPFILTVAIFAVASDLVHSQSEKGDAVAADSRDAKSDSQPSKTPDWERQHAERMKLNKNLAGRIDRVTKINERSRIIDELRAIAAGLPEDSRHAQRIQGIAKEIAKVEDDTDKLLTGEITNRLQSLSKQLSFEPKMESKLPVGFPAPTPVGEIEVKDYPAYRMAKTSMSNSGNSSFFRLFNHIQSNDISMTAPVEITYNKGESGLKETEMAFLYGDPSIGATNGEGEVEVVDVSPRKAIVMGVKGRPSDQRIAEVIRTLRKHANEAAPGFKTAESPKVFGYNSPSIPSGSQFYEILLELRPTSAKHD